MKLLYNATSPYARKARILIHELGLLDRVEPVEANPWVADSAVPADNPLGKVPVLIADDGRHLYDSPVICEYLDALAGGGRFFPPAGPARWTALTRQALGDGILDAALLLRVETAMRPAELKWSDWADRQTATIRRGLDVAEQQAADFGEAFTIGEVTLVAVCGYLDLRFADLAWRASRPQLAAWYARQTGRPSVTTTQPPG